MIGKTISHYKILEKLGEGGMGIVYKAEDLKLKRTVALKFLPPELTRDPEAKERFIQEAQAASALDHPNICNIHEIDETEDGQMFICMAYYDGETLKKKIASGESREAGSPSAGLSVDSVIDIAIQIAQGLVKAHEHGITHRDIKPGNIMITKDGMVKILDFGLAKLAGQVGLTKTGTTVGTIAYMSPEQARGEDVDHRTDIWSFGVVLYEMVTGKLPFRGEYDQAVVYSIMNEPPEPLITTGSGSSVPMELERIVNKAMKKTRDERYRHAEEMLSDLRSLRKMTEVEKSSKEVPIPLLRERKKIYKFVGAVLVVVLSIVAVVKLFQPGREAINSLAVLPLSNLSGDPEQEYFVDGMTEALITELSKISALKIISRTSVMQYKGVKKSLPDIARELRVQAVVEGSVLRVGDRIRVTAQLIHAPTDAHLWAENYERDLRGVLRLQSDVTRQIAREIKVTLTPAEKTRLGSARAVNPEAHEFYIRGRYQWNKRTEEDFRQAIQFFQQAIEKDPTYAPAYAGLADVYAVQPSWGLASPSEAYPRARAIALKALELDENLAEPYATLGSIKSEYDRDWSGAEQDYRRALNLNPNYATAHLWYGIFLSGLGKHNEAIAELESAERIDPLAPIISEWLGVALYFARRYDQAVRQLRKAVEMPPESSSAFVFLGMAYTQMGMYAEALAAADKGSRLPDALHYGSVGWIYARAGRKAEAQRRLRRLQELSSQQDIDAGAIAMIYIGLGQKEQALTSLERAYEQRGSYQIFFIKVEPAWDPLRDDPRFQDLLRRMNFAEN